MPGPGPGAGGGYPRIFFKKKIKPFIFFDLISRYFRRGYPRIFLKKIKNPSHLYFHMVYFLDVGVDFNQWSKPYFYTLLGPVQQPIWTVWFNRLKPWHSSWGPTQASASFKNSAASSSRTLIEERTVGCAGWVYLYHFLSHSLVAPSAKGPLPWPSDSKTNLSRR